MGARRTSDVEAPLSPGVGGVEETSGASGAVDDYRDLTAKEEADVEEVGGCGVELAALFLPLLRGSYGVVRLTRLVGSARFPAPLPRIASFI